MYRKYPAKHIVMALALPDIVAIDLAIPAQIFGHEDQKERYDFRVCAPNAGFVSSTTGFSIHAPFGLDALEQADTVIVPGFAPLVRPSDKVISALQGASARGARILSVCTGAFALAEAKLLDNRRATTHWQDSENLSRRHPKVSVDPNVLYIDSGQVLTSAGVCAGIDLCLYIVRLDFGSEAAAHIARRMVVPLYRSGGQAQYIPSPVPKYGDGMSATCAWAIERLGEPLTVSELARHAHHAPRTFARLFVAEIGVTPQRWLTSCRVTEARRLLETTELTISEIASRCGFGSTANFRVHFFRDTTCTPAQYRAAFRAL